MTTTYTYTDINVPGSFQNTTAAIGINNSGEVSGYYSDGSHTHAFTDISGNYTTVDFPNASVDPTVGSRLNNDGDLVGYLYFSGYTYGYFNGTETGWQGFALGVSSTTVAYGVNDADLVVGIFNNGHNYYSGFTTTDFSTYTTLNAPGSNGTFAYDINNSGVIVGQYFSTGDNHYHGFEYDGTTWTTLDAPGYNNTTPEGINNAGDIVGYLFDAQNVVHGFEYSNGTYTIIDRGGPTSLFDINDSGQITGISNGQAFVATPGPDLVFTTPASVVGAAQEGQVLTADGAVNDPTAVITYQWQFNVTGNDWADIVGATSSTYTVAEVDEGHAIRVVESATAGSTTATSTSDPTVSVIDIGLAFVTGGFIVGMAKEGQVLTLVPGTLNDSDAAISSYQWQENIGGTWTDILGATSQTYTVTEANEGNRLRVMQTATDTDGGPLVNLSSDPTGFVADIDLAFTSQASITGAAQEGQVLSAVNGSLNDSDAAVTGYQWQENIGGTWTDIPGAIAQTYTVTETNEGNQVRVIETATDSDGGPAVTSVSAPTSAVTDITLGFTSGASINNTSPKEGDVLRAINGSLNDGDAGVTGYQWQQQVGGVWTDIVGATSQTYAVKKSNDNHELRVIETATDTDGGPTITSVSDPTAAVIPTQSPPPGTSAFLFQSSGGLYQVYVLGDNSVLAGGYSLGDVYGELGGITYLNGALDHVSMVVHDTLTGEVKSINVQDNRVVGETHLGAVGVDWDISGFRSEEHVGDGMVMRNATAGDLEGYSISNGQIVSADQMGKVGLDWKVEGFGNFGDTPGGMVMRNENTGALEVYDIKGNSITGASSLGTVGTDWKVSGFGDFNGDGSTDMLMRNSVTGGLQLYEIAGDKITNTSFLGTIGNEWEFAGVTTLDDHSGQESLVLRNSSTGQLEGYKISGGSITHAAPIGSGNVDNVVAGLIQASASFGTAGSSEGLGSVTQNDQQQQTFLTTPHS
jgi:probable HAF family extracellular repeat protein